MLLDLRFVPHPHLRSQVIVSVGAWADNSVNAMYAFSVLNSFSYGMLWCVPSTALESMYLSCCVVVGVGPCVRVGGGRGKGGVAKGAQGSGSGRER
jgi:hypothetical protein